MLAVSTTLMLSRLLASIESEFYITSQGIALLAISWPSLRLGYGVPPTQLAVSFISHEYHYVGVTQWLWLWGLPQSDQIYTVSTGHVV